MSSSAIFEILVLSVNHQKWKICPNVGVYYTFNRYHILQKSGKSVEFKFTTNLDNYAKSKETWLALGKELFSFLLLR